MRPAILLLLALSFSACRKPEDEKVRYEVQCSSCSLTYANSSGNTEQRDMTTSWNYEFTAEKARWLYISAQNNNASGTVGVKIIVRGGTIESASSSGAYVIATASGSMP